MFDIKEDIKKIVENGDNAQMEKLSDILEEVVEIVRNYDEDMYDKYAMCIYKMANGYALNQEMADEVVAGMKPYGEHWTMEQTTSVKNQYGYTDVNNIDFWVVMNSAYNDYRDIFKENLDVYAKWSYAFIKDEDAKEGKVFNYFTKVAKSDIY